MPKKTYFAFSISLLILSVIFSLYFALTGLLLYSGLFLLGLVVGTVLLIHWSTISYKWECSKCKDTIKLSFIENVKGVNIGMNKKNLYCNTCNKKVPFNGIKK